MRDRYDFASGVTGKYVGKIEHRLLPATPKERWRHPSVRNLAGDRDPVAVVVELARQVVLEAIDSKVTALPVDPFKLAESRGVQVIPRPDVRDARTICGLHNRPVIEFNPNRPRTRIRFSICHELAHTLFPDCTEQVRHRLFHAETSPVASELEMLCNLAAAEFLLPIGSIQEDMSKLDLSIDAALKLRVKYEASVESVLLRLVGLSAGKCAIFAAVADESSAAADRRYRLEYVKGTQHWSVGLKRGHVLPRDTAATECSAIGFTAVSEEQWIPDQHKFRVEMVGVTPYPNRVIPRVVGLIKPIGHDAAKESPIRILRGDALEPRGSGEKIIAHIANDRTPNWGAGFGKALQSKWPDAQSQFKAFFERIKGQKLGQTNLSRVSSDICAFQMICQRGYGPSRTPRLRYGALRDCLEELREAALQRNAAVHMPKIGTGEAGGSWGIISNLIIEELSAKGVSVTVYEPPTKRESWNQQADLFSDATK